MSGDLTVNKRIEINVIGMDVTLLVTEKAEIYDIEWVLLRGQTYHLSTVSITAVKDGITYEILNDQKRAKQSVFSEDGLVSEQAMINEATTFINNVLISAVINSLPEE